MTFKFLIFLTLLFNIGFISIKAQQSSSEQTDFVYVFGNVLKISKITFAESLTLTQAVEKSGGIEFKKKNVKVRVYRFLSRSIERNIIEIDLTQIIKGKAEDIKLNPYDLIDVVCPKGKKCTGALKNTFPH